MKIINASMFMFLSFALLAITPTYTCAATLSTHSVPSNRGPPSLSGIDNMMVEEIALHRLLDDYHNSFNNRVIGGRPAKEGEIPYQVSLRWAYTDDHYCGGSLVTAKHVLMAAHCAYYRWGGVLPPSAVSVVSGQLTLPTTEKTVFRNASLITIHPGYSKTTFANDVAIIEVDRAFPIETSPFIDIINLRNSSIDAGACSVSGWGVEKYGSVDASPVLLVTEVNIVDFNKCQSMFGPPHSSVILSEGMLCAGHENGTTDACKGDSGGPLVCDGLLTGVTSFGIDCGSADYPGVYSDVVHFLPWIEENIKFN